MGTKFHHQRAKVMEINALHFSVHHFKQFMQTSILATLPTIVTGRFIIEHNEFVDELKSIKHKTVAIKMLLELLWVQISWVSCILTRDATRRLSRPMNVEISTLPTF